MKALTDSECWSIEIYRDCNQLIAGPDLWDQLQEITKYMETIVIFD